MSNFFEAIEANILINNGGQCFIEVSVLCLASVVAMAGSGRFLCETLSSAPVATVLMVVEVML